MKYVLLLLVGLLFSCGDDVVESDEFEPRTSQTPGCSGCISNGECEVGDDNNECGAGGEVCFACESGFTCDENRVCSIPPECTPKTVKDVARIMAYVEAEMKHKLVGQEPIRVQFVLMDGLAMARLAYRQPIFAVQTIVQDAVMV